MVGSRCVVQDRNNRSNRAVGISLHSPSVKTRDVWRWFVRTKRKNFNPKPGTKFLICSVHFEGVKRESLPSIWKKAEPKKSKRNRRMKEKDRQKVSTRNARTLLCCYFSFDQAVSLYFNKQSYKQ